MAKSISSLAITQETNDETEKKTGNEKIIEDANRIIGELVTERDDLRKAYNYYLGVMDKDQLTYIEETYGLGNPTAIEFIPLVKRHIDVLIGEHIDNKFDPKITCKDYKTLENIKKMKEEKVTSTEVNFLKQKLNDNIRAAVNNTTPGSYNDDELRSIKDSVNREFISEYEMAAQYIIEYTKQSRDIYLDYKRETLMRDYLITGQCYYQISYDAEGSLPTIEVHSPLDVFHKRNIHSPFVRDASRAVIRRYMTPDQIISRYGRYLSDEEIDELERIFSVGDDNAGVYYVYSDNSDEDGYTMLPGDSPHTCSPTHAHPLLS